MNTNALDPLEKVTEILKDLHKPHKPTMLENSIDYYIYSLTSLRLLYPQSLIQTDEMRDGEIYLTPVGNTYISSLTGGIYNFTLEQAVDRVWRIYKESEVAAPTISEIAMCKNCLCEMKLSSIGYQGVYHYKCSSCKYKALEGKELRVSRDAWTAIYLFVNTQRGKAFDKLEKIERIIIGECEE